MSMNDSIANALSKIEIYDKLGRKKVELTPSSKLLKGILQIMNEQGYIGTFEEDDNKRGGILNLNLINKLNKCGVIKPRFSCELNEFEKFEKRFLLAKGFGILIVSTSQGLMTHDEAKEKKIGGKLIAYCY
ncbi:MAG: 30S ribosomal protein S8 [Candidatus Woesearchaeota archaeon]